MDTFGWILQMVLSPQKALGGWAHLEWYRPLFTLKSRLRVFTSKLRDHDLRGMFFFYL